MKSQLLRFATAGSVDNGKSTLIGRLLYDTKSIFEDQLTSVKKTSVRQGNDLNLALFTDGLRDEVELGITIDVAYRYFATPKRKFIIADAPGHREFTRNMVTAASTTNAVIILIDAKHGITEQTKRHSFIGSLLEIPQIIVCVNKMDAVDWSQKVFSSIVEDYRELASKLFVKDIQFIPMSALKGDNVVNPSKNMDWYEGSPLLHLLESMPISRELNKIDARLPVQLLLANDGSNYTVAGRIESGTLRNGDEIIALPSGANGKINSIRIGELELDKAIAPMSVSLKITSKSPIERGEIVTRLSDQPKMANSFNAMLCWLNDVSSETTTKYVLRSTTQSVNAKIKNVLHKVDVNTFNLYSDDVKLRMNDICKVEIQLEKELVFDSFAENRIMGSFILVDPISNATVAAGMIQ
ncbi:MAG: sulfate adenylyltransferase subunit 1 [Flavobacteriaceae bacterium]|jgi:sulfate adenylyltransferase subunit 1